MKIILFFCEKKRMIRAPWKRVLTLIDSLANSLVPEPCSTVEKVGRRQDIRHFCCSRSVVGLVRTLPLHQRN